MKNVRPFRVFFLLLSLLLPGVPEAQAQVAGFSRSPNQRVEVVQMHYLRLLRFQVEQPWLTGLLQPALPLSGAALIDIQSQDVIPVTPDPSQTIRIRNNP